MRIICTKCGSIYDRRWTRPTFYGTRYCPICDAEGCFTEATLAEIKRVINYYFDDADSGIYFTRNNVNDITINVYTDTTTAISIYVCYKYHYIEIFGLTEEEREEITEYYNSLIA